MLVKHSCGCLPGTANNTCKPLGDCNSLPRAQYECKCLFANYTGTYCQECSKGYTLYPKCLKVIPCDKPCVHGKCDNLTGTCACESGYSGATCDSKPDSAVFFVIVGIFITALIGAVVVFLIRKGVCRRSPKETFIPLTQANSYDMSDDLDIDIETSEEDKKKRFFWIS